VQDSPLDEKLLDPAVGGEWLWCSWVAKQRKEMVVGHPPDISEDDHEGSQPNLKLVLELVFEDSGPRVESSRTLAL
jgi:hypothetical protein